MSRNTSTPRFRWIAEQIRNCLGADAAAVEAFLQGEDVYAQFQALCTRPEAPPKVFVHFQPKNVTTPVSFALVN